MSKVHPFYKVYIACLQVNEALTTVFLEYSDFADIFSLKLTTKQPEHTKIKDHVIDLINGKKPSYGLIYSLELVELEPLRIFIKTNETTIL